jgi:hypothetical protein
MGCTEEEFDRKIASVVAQIRRIRSPGDAADAISGVCNSAIHPEGFLPDDCADVGRRLYKALDRSHLPAK